MDTDSLIQRSRSLRDRLATCPPGRAGWKQFEDAALGALCHLLVPPLTKPRIQPRSLSGIDRRDAVFPNRIYDTSQAWGLLRKDYDARYLLVEFKNYDSEDIGKDEVDQTRNYLTRAFGRLAIIVSNKPPQASALRRRNTVFSEENKLILFLTTTNLREMLDMKDRGDDPTDFILDAIDEFVLQFE
jgi:hypothetical protein